MIKLSVPGPPYGKARARVVRLRNGRSLAFTPDKTARMENLVRTVFAAEFPGHVPIAGAICMDIQAFMPIPKSTPKRLAALMIQENVPHTKKPDRSNIEKLAEDALNGVAYVDDCQIFDGNTRKVYSARPRLEISIREFVPGEYLSTRRGAGPDEKAAAQAQGGDDEGPRWKRRL